MSGEAFAGIYVPTLAKLIHDLNARGEPKINLKGFIVGNGIVDQVCTMKKNIVNLSKGNICVNTNSALAATFKSK